MVIFWGYAHMEWVAHIVFVAVMPSPLEMNGWRPSTRSLSLSQERSIQSMVIFCTTTMLAIVFSSAISLLYVYCFMLVLRVWWWSVVIWWCCSLYNCLSRCLRHHHCSGFGRDRPSAAAIDFLLVKVSTSWCIFNLIMTHQLSECRQPTTSAKWIC